jgi:KTSC domain
MIARLAAALIAVLITAEVRSETVDVKYRGTVDLKTSECRATPRSSLIQRVCYDRPRRCMVINLTGTHYHYCELPLATFEAFMAAPSMGRYFNQNVKGYDCRTHGIPKSHNLRPADG